jgi:dTDP-4-amino-4,6-dideoxygalactose transaminase
MTISDLIRHRQGGFILPPFERLGYNYRMTDIQAAIGVEQMKKLPFILKERINKANYYNRALADLDKLLLPISTKDYQHSYQSYVILLKRNKKLSRGQLANYLLRSGIATRQGTHAVHTLGFYKKKYKFKRDQFPNSLKADRLTLTLPLYSTLKTEEQSFVINKIKKIFPM